MHALGELKIRTVEMPDNASVENIRRLVAKSHRPWYFHPAVVYPGAFLVSGLAWLGIIELAMHATAMYSAVAAQLAWFWDSGPEDSPWTGPARWWAVTGACCVAWCCIVGVWEWWRDRR